MGNKQGNNNQGELLKLLALKGTSLSTKLSWRATTTNKRRQKWW